MLEYVFTFCYYSIFLLVPYLVFVFFTKDDNFHSAGGLLYLIKFIFVKRLLKSSKHPLVSDGEIESISNKFSVIALDQTGNILKIKLTFHADHSAESNIYLKINGNLYISPGGRKISKNSYRFSRKTVANNKWICDGLRVEILEPFKRLRILFNGFLLNLSENKTHPMKFALIWNSCSKPISRQEDSDLDFLSSQLAGTKWRSGEWMNLTDDENGYIQFGALKGLISGENLNEEEFNFSSVANHSYYSTLEEIDSNERSTIFGATLNGNLFYFGARNIKNGCKNLKFGHVLTRIGTVFPIQSSDFNLEMLHKGVSNKLTVHLKANGKTFKLLLEYEKNSMKFSNDSGNEDENLTGSFAVNSYKGVAFFEKSKNGFSVSRNSKISRSILHELSVKRIPEILTTKIEDEEARIVELAGGKGTSLALMKTLNRVNIPNGFIVTTYAFQKQLDSNPELKNSILDLKSYSESECEKIVELFNAQQLLTEISDAICENIAILRKKRPKKDILFAVRSSAVGEDSEEFSSAGQNDTYLGCKSKEEVIEKVLKCWGSLYSFPSVTYRTNHGLEIFAKMAVVVQEMVPADAAGVLFTCHPRSLNPGKMFITSNFGLGESVVSGESDPDSITLKRSYSGEISFDSFNLGSKKISHIMNEDGVNKFEDEKENDNESLSKEFAIELGKIGVFLEESFGSPRDIEWALFDNQFYILQSRPITTLNEWSDYDLTHEFDYPHISNDIFYTKGNIGEVLCNAISPLTLTTVTDSIDKGYQLRMFNEYNPCVRRILACSHNHCMIELLGGLYAKATEEVSIAQKLVDLAVFGRIVLDEELNQLAIERYGAKSKFEFFQEIVNVGNMLWNANKILKQLLQDVDEFKIDIREYDEPSEMLEKIDGVMEKLTEISNFHCSISSVSVMYQTLTLVLLLEGEKDISHEHYNDIAFILSSCDDVISADIPKRLEKMAAVLKKQGVDEKFVSEDPQNGVEWLKKNCEEVYALLEEFLNIHGHRSVGECDLVVKPWEMDCSEVIKMLQANCKMETSSVSSRKTREPCSEIIKKLKTPRKKTTKFLLKFLVDKYRTSVGNREQSKSAMVKAVNIIRIAFYKLAKKMVNLGLIPSEKTIFFLTRHEIGFVLSGNGQHLITKALRRQKLYPAWNDLKFPEISYGIPVPEKQDCSKDFTGQVLCSGTPVTSGEVTARACVITSLDEINQLTEGDVLITRSTDIGWSPYFPTLSGLVTELGGLVSHGAVVAREYGLPCLVNAKNATKIFETGDMVRFSSKTGNIEKLKKQ